MIHSSCSARQVAVAAAVAVSVGLGASASTASALIRPAVNTARNHETDRHAERRHKGHWHKNAKLRAEKKVTATTASVSRATLNANGKSTSRTGPKSTVTTKTGSVVTTTTTTPAAAPTTTTTRGNTATTTTASGASTATSTPQPVGVPGNWNLVMDSEFDAPSLNTNIWTPGWFGTGVTDPVNSGEDDCYSSDNVNESGGTLNLSVTAQSSTCNGKTYPYTGALVSTNPNGSNSGFTYTYGVVEARVYIPAAANGEIANWPAVWAVTTPSEDYGEDDSFEGLAGQACYHYHSSAGAPGACDTALTPGWHTFASDWQPGSITYYYDGVNVGSITSGISSEPMYVILDNTISANNTNLASPSTMKVQYVRVWQN